MNKPTALFVSFALLVIGGVGAYFILHNANRVIPSVAIITASSTPETTTATSSVETATPPASTQPIRAYGLITLPIGGSVMYGAGKLQITNLAEDSRCPTDVNCIQAGTIKVGVQVSSGNNPIEGFLQLGNTTTIGALSITLEAVSPIKTTKVTLQPKDYQFTIRVEKTNTTTAKSQCYIGGCSSELCTDTEHMVSSCIYRDSFVCYKGAACARQSTGSCGWTQTTALKQCLAGTMSL